MPACFFATDLHGRTARYGKLFAAIAAERPAAVFLGGDLLPSGASPPAEPHFHDFLHDYMIPEFARLRYSLGDAYPSVFLILGNDDPRYEEESFCADAAAELWQYIHQRKASLGDLAVYGYAYVPPTPFLLKDWERYDVSRYIPPACVSPEEGYRSLAIDEMDIRWGTIHKDLAALAGDASLDRAIFLFHTPPYDTPLDRAALDGKLFEHVELDVHVGSIAVRRFIEHRQPLLTLHGHIHESTRLTGDWKTTLGRTVCINAAHDGPELSLVRFDPESPAAATRDLL